jgi:hypothetical protein
MRRADILFALLLFFVALYTMYESTQLRIGWIRGMGPGGGAFPFWLGAIMAACCLVVIVRAIIQGARGPFFVDRPARLIVVKAVGLFIAAVAAIPLVGVYGTTALLLAVYMRWLGEHQWPQTIMISVLVPTGLFLFFEKFLVVPLPKGLLEPFFYYAY